MVANWLNIIILKTIVLTSCIATDTRLMGVVARKVSWTASDGSRDKLFQLIHLDFSEYGVDDYRRDIL